MSRSAFRRSRLLCLAIFLVGCASGVNRELPFIEDAPSPTAAVGTLAVTGGSTTVGVVNSIDDAEETVNGGAVALANTALTLGAKGGAAQIVGFRFQNVGIPKGATITSAFLEVKAAAASSAAATFTIKGEKADGAIGYRTIAGDLASRPKTSAAVSWTPAAWTSGTAYRTGDLVGIIREIVAQPGWYQGNALALQLTGSGTSTRSVAAFDGGAANAPKLIVTFTYDPATSPTYLSRSLAAGTDDAEQPGTAAAVTNSTVLEIGQNGTTAQTVGLRFPNLTIPPGATIHKANLVVTSTAANSSTTNYTITAEASDSAVAFTTAANNLGARPKVANPASVAWPTGAFSANTNYGTVSVAPLLKQLVDRPGWRSGNAAAFFIAGTGTRPVVAFEGGAANAARLVVNYTPAATLPPNPCSSLNGTLPSPWAGGDVGTVGTAGKAGSASNVFDLCGYGAGLGASSDAFHFVRQTLNGDGTLTARLTSLDAAATTARAGVMIRETTNANAKYAALYVDGANAKGFVNRGGTAAAMAPSGLIGEILGRGGTDVSGGEVAGIFDQVQDVAAGDDQTGGIFEQLGGVATTLSPQANQLTAPVWLRITRKGTALSSYTSADGQAWTPAGTITLSLTSSVQVGLFSTGQGSSTPATAKFDNVTLGPPVGESNPCDTLGGTLGAPWTSEHPGPFGIPGKAAQPAADRLDVCGAGGGFADDEDLQYVRQTLNGNGALTVKLTELPAGAQAGVLVRGGWAYGPDMTAAGLFVEPGAPARFEFYGETLTEAFIGARTADGRPSALAEAAATLFGTTGGTADPELAAQANALAAPQWLRVERVNQTLTGYVSADGATWQTVGGANIAMVQNITVGVTVASGDPDALALGRFENVSVAPGPPFVPPSGPLPESYARADIGPVGAPGSSSFDEDSGALSVTGFGNGTPGADAQHFVYQPLTGDGTVTVRLNNLDAPSTTARAGVMVRETTAADAKYAALYIDGANARGFTNRGGTAVTARGEVAGAGTEEAQGSSFFEQVRTVAADDDQTADVFDQIGSVAGTLTPQANRLAAPVWLRITRRGTGLYSYTSTDGTTWTPAGTATVAMGETTSVGVWASSSSSTAPAQARFDNVTVEDLPEPAPLPSPWERSDIGALAAPGSSSFAEDTFQLGAAATGLGEQADALHYVHQPLGRDSSLTVRVSALADDAKVGLSLRYGLAPNDSHASLWVQGRNGVPSFVTRSSGSATSSTNVFGTVQEVAGAPASSVRVTSLSNVAAPPSLEAAAAPPEASIWLRLSRKGNGVGAFTSADGQTWQQVGYATLATSSGATMGFWVAGGSGEVSASLDNVGVGTTEGDLYDPGEPVEILLNPWKKATIGSGTGQTGVRNDNALYSLSAQGGTDAAPVTEFMYRRERSGDALYVGVGELRALEADGAVGLMLRDGLTTSAAYAFLKVTPRGVVLESGQGGTPSETLLQPARRTLPLWLRIASVDNTVTVYGTQDVVTWEPLGSVQVSLGSTRYLGIAARSSGGAVTGAFTRPRLVHAGDSALAGIDGDEDGVRDDVQHYLGVAFAGAAPALRDALTQVARSGSAVLSSGNVATLNGYNADRYSAGQLLGEANAYQLGLLEGELFDTPDRLSRYLALAKPVGEAFVRGSSTQRSYASPKETTSAFSLGALAENCPEGTNSTSNVTRFYFGNGINGVPAAVLRTATEVIPQAFDSTLKALKPDEEFQYDFAFNPGNGFRDYREIGLLKLREIGRREGWLADPWDSHDVMQTFYDTRARSILTPIQTQVLQEVYIERALQNDPTNAVVDAHFEMYKTDLMAGHIVIVLAHSQGGPIFNRVYQRLAQDPEVGDKIRALAVVQVATLTDHVEGKDPNAYVTDTNDAPVKAVSSNPVYNVLPPNVTNDVVPPWYYTGPTGSGFPTWLIRDQSGHSLENVYLKEGSPARAEVERVLTNQITSTFHPCIEDPGGGGTGGGSGGGTGGGTGGGSGGGTGGTTEGGATGGTTGGSTTGGTTGGSTTGGTTGGTGGSTTGGSTTGGSTTGGSTTGGSTTGGSTGGSTTGDPGNGPGFTPPPGGPGNGGETWGDPHIFTIDGGVYTFMATGDYILSEATDPQDPFVVQVRFRPFQGPTWAHVDSTQWSANEAVAMNVEGDVVEFYAVDRSTQPLVVVNGEQVQPSSGPVIPLPGGGTVKLSEQQASVSWKDGTSVLAELSAAEAGDWMVAGRVKVNLSAARSQKVHGLLGNNDGVATNDLRLRDGTQLNLNPTPTGYNFSSEELTNELYTGPFRASWRVQPSESLFSRGTDPFDPSYPSEALRYEGLDPEKVALAEAACEAQGVRSAAMLSRCILDIVNTGDNSFAEVAAAADPRVPSISVSPEAIYLSSSETRTLTAFVNGLEADPSIIWETNGGRIEGTGMSVEYVPPETSGTYTVTATLASDPNLSSSVSIVVAEALEVTADVLLNNEVVFTAEPPQQINAPLNQYRWQFGDGTEMTTSVPYVRHQYPLHGMYPNYTITLAASNNLGNSFTKRFEIVVSGGSLANARVIQPDSNTESAITSADLYKFSGTAGQEVSITYVELRGYLDLDVRLYNDAGDLLEQQQGSGQRLRFTPVESGEYYIELVDNNLDGQPSDYVLGLANLEEPTQLSPATLPFVLNEAFEIIGDVHLYTFSPTFSDTVDITFRSLGSNLEGSFVVSSGPGGETIGHAFGPGQPSATEGPVEVQPGSNLFMFIEPGRVFFPTLASANASQIPDNMFVGDYSLTIDSAGVAGRAAKGD